MIRFTSFFILLLITSHVQRTEMHKGNQPISTIVTTLYNVKRGQLAVKGEARSWQFYTHHFKQLLQTQANLIIFGDKELHQFVKVNRNRTNTVFIQREVQQLKKSWHYFLIKKNIQHFKQDPIVWEEKKKLVFYLLELYNTVVMSKLFFMNQAIKYDIWNSDYFIWLDGGINRAFTTNFVDNIMAPVNPYEQLTFLMQWPSNGRVILWKEYEDVIQPHQQDYFYPLAGSFGLYIEMVRDLKGAYENLLRINLQTYNMFSDETVFRQMFKRYPTLFPLLTYIKLQAIQHKIHLNHIYDLKIETMRTFNLSNEFYQFMQRQLNKANPYKIQDNRHFINKTIKNIQSQYYYSWINEQMQQFYHKTIIFYVMVIISEIVFWKIIKDRIKVYMKEIMINSFNDD